ncbi:MAG: alginate lyase family protein, partial [Candidatus Latescibacteria bacterium]|nr:alginate lyase family protein [Candidatus Latescibacterota bacterium]
KLERMYHYDLYLAMPNLCLPALNDGGQTDIATYLRGGFKFFPERTDFQWAATGRAAGTKPETLSCAFPYAGHFAMRTGWDPEDLYLFFDGGPFGYGHQHEDKLNIMLYAHGRVHVVDPGNYPYDSSQWRTYVLSTRAHNTVIVDGLEQNQRGKSREEYVVSEPLPHTWISEEKYDYVSASYDLGYGPDRDQTVTHTRSILFVKPEMWIVTDILRPSDDALHTYEGMFHLDADDAEVLGNGRDVLTKNGEGESNLGIYAIATKPIQTNIVSGQEEPTVQGWIPRGAPYECVPIPTPIFKAEGEGVTVMSYILYPIKAGEESPVTSVEYIPVTGDNNRAGIGGRIALGEGREIYFVQSEAGEGVIHAGGGETDAEAGIMELSNGRVDRLVLVNGTELRINGQVIKEGDYL